MPLIGNVLKPLAKNVLIPLGLTVVASATDAALIISNEDMSDIKKIVKCLEQSKLLIKT